MHFCVVFLWRLYHCERKWGTTTYGEQDNSLEKLYHYERKWGTTTDKSSVHKYSQLYHYERKWGTTTLRQLVKCLLMLYHYGRKWGTTTMSQPQIFRDDFTAYYIRIYRFRQSPKWRETFLTKIVPGNGCSLPWSSPGRHL